MNLRVVFLVAVNWALQSYSMDEIEQAMRACELSKVQGKLTASDLKEDPVRWWSAAKESSCSDNAMQLILDEWGKKYSNGLPFSRSFGCEVNARVNKTAAPHKKGQNHFLNESPDSVIRFIVGYNGPNS